MIHSFFVDVLKAIVHDILRPLLVQLMAWAIVAAFVVYVVFPHLGDITLWIVKTGMQQMAHTTVPTATPEPSWWPFGH